jgi:hypothetical protein
MDQVGEPAALQIGRMKRLAGGAGFIHQEGWGRP